MCLAPVDPALDGAGRVKSSGRGARRPRWGGAYAVRTATGISILHDEYADIEDFAGFHVVEL
ncbi:hypothetical protein EDC25_10422 [Pseudofulvimonas gallinarii]|jgi:hypothetical protein|uniref:Uncharacterized protein n=1 Tax=Pseudofulvimonas gallinarii TaxID=634155 RepID=A0A4R3LNF1_9GAMM|nr:hypothetical protein EDC25_10422 [Pseudofulvimonas gallinarii]